MRFRSLNTTYLKDNLSGKLVYIDAPAAKNINAMVAIEDGAVWPCFQAARLTKR
jgi:hypothetical protein